jgi:hypothetical protein
MANCLVAETGWRKVEWTQLFPPLLENATLIKDLRKKRSLCFDKARPRRGASFPRCLLKPQLVIATTKQIDWMRILGVQICAARNTT